MFKEEKAIQCLGFCLKRYVKGIDVNDIMLILFLADRESLTNNGYSITTDNYFVNENGVGLENIYNWILNNKDTKNFQNNMFNLFFVVKNNHLNFIDNFSRKYMKNGTLSVDNEKILTKNINFVLKDNNSKKISFKIPFSSEYLLNSIPELDTETRCEMIGEMKYHNKLDELMKNTEVKNMNFTSYTEEEIEFIEKRYKEIISIRYPNIIVRAVTFDFDLIIEVFMVPDSKGAEFATYSMSQLYKLVKSKGVPYLPICEFSETATKKYYPDICKKYGIK
jgi:hypothetical protein